MNAVEGIFAQLTRRCLQRGEFNSVEALHSAITQFLAVHNTREDRPFCWRKDPEAIIAARKRGYHKLETIH